MKYRIGKKQHTPPLDKAREECGVIRRHKDAGIVGRVFSLGSLPIEAARKIAAGCRLGFC